MNGQIVGRRQNSLQFLLPTFPSVYLSFDCVVPMHRITPTKFPVKSSSVKREKKQQTCEILCICMWILWAQQMLTGVGAHTDHRGTLPRFTAPSFISRASVCFSPRSRQWGKNPESTRKWEERQVVWAVWWCDFAVSLWSATVWFFFHQLWLFSLFIYSST